MEFTCLRLWTTCSSKTSRKIQRSPGSTLAAPQAFSGSTQACVSPTHHSLHMHFFSSAVEEWCSSQTWDWHGSCQCRRMLVNRDDSDFRLSSSAAANEPLRVCVCVWGLIIWGFVTQLVLLVCSLIHYSWFDSLLPSIPTIHLLLYSSIHPPRWISRSSAVTIKCSCVFSLTAGIQWTPDENGVVTFDCRNRNWYVRVHQLLLCFPNWGSGPLRGRRIKAK